ncbi:uncharacterized protein V1513DRAFT_474702 [Lipomyces chichibuensis]|uniref:uncharacterized protein n=1 Tax=Lipomyces chichibuensis TaxID=1546026 RepID=UPI0033430D47
MSGRLIKLQHRLRLTGYSENVATKAIKAEKDYFPSKQSLESEQYLELFESIQNITDIEAQWDALRQTFRAGDEISLADIREFVENENLRQQLMEKKRELINIPCQGSRLGACRDDILKRKKLEKLFFEILLKRREICLDWNEKVEDHNFEACAAAVQRQPSLEKAVEKYNDILNDREFESIANEPPQINVNVTKDALNDDDLTGFK